MIGDWVMRFILWGSAPAEMAAILFLLATSFNDAELQRFSFAKITLRLLANCSSDVYSRLHGVTSGQRITGNDVADVFQTVFHR